MQNVYILINLISYVGVVITQLSKTTSFSSNKWNVDIGTRKTLERVMNNDGWIERRRIFEWNKEKRKQTSESIRLPESPGAPGN